MAEKEKGSERRKLEIPLLDEGSYEDWKWQLGLWRKVCGYTKSDQGLILVLSLKGKAKDAVRNVDLDVLQDEGGVDEVIKRLDRVFMADKGVRKFAKFVEVQELVRSTETPMVDFILTFEKIYREFEQECGVQEDSLKAFSLLRSSNLTRKDIQDVLTVAEDVTYDIVRKVLKRRFCLEKTEIVKGFTQKSTGGEGDIMVGASGIQTPGIAADEYWGNQGYERGAKPKRFWRGRGRGGVGRGRGRCVVCGSTYHWARECPDSYANKKEKESKVGDGQDKYDMALVENILNISLDEGVKNLVDEASGMALIDTGCSGTVCGERWLQEYLEGKEDYLLGEEETSAEYRFGGKAKIGAKRRVVIVGFIGGKRYGIRTDVVENEIPMVMSIKSLQKLGVNINCEEMKVLVKGVVVPTVRLSGGHLCFPLRE